jgi:hypothetical protein
MLLYSINRFLKQHRRDVRWSGSYVALRMALSRTHILLLVVAPFSRRFLRHLLPHTVNGVESQCSSKTWICFLQRGLPSYNRMVPSPCFRLCPRVICGWFLPKVMEAHGDSESESCLAPSAGTARTAQAGVVKVANFR